MMLLPTAMRIQDDSLQLGKRKPRPEEIKQEAEKNGAAWELTKFERHDYSPTIRSDLGIVTSFYQSGEQTVTFEFKYKQPETKQPVSDAEQAAFEGWLERACPSGDSEQVHAQWLDSWAYEEFCESLKQPESDGWIEWNGGECPVAPHTKVSVRFRFSDENSVLEARHWNWRHFGKTGYGGHAGEIIAYKVLPC